MKKARCFADGGQISKADQLIAEMNAKYGVSGNSQPEPPPVQQTVPQPAPQPQSRGLVGDALNLFSNRQKQIDKAAGYANGGLIGNAAQYWQDDNAKFEQASPNIGQRILRGINPITGFGSAMGAMKSAAEQGSIPGMGMALIQAIPAAGMMRAMPAVGAVKASVAPSVARTAVATGGGATANAIADDVQQRTAYRNGGKIQGSGTPTSDSIDAQVNETGEPIKVSTKERIVSHEQDKLLQRLAKAMGFESVDAFFEAGTGKPVGPTIKGGKMAHSEGGKPAGWRLDNEPDAYAKAMQETRNSLSIPSLGTNNAAAQGGIYKDVGLPSISVGAGQAPTIYDNGGLPTATDRVIGSLPVAKQPVATPGSSLFDKDPLTAMSSGIAKSMASSDAANAGLQNLYPAGTFDSTTAPQPATAKTGVASSAQANNPVYAPSANRSGEANPNSAYGQGSVRAPGGIGSFAQDGKTYNVAGTSQDNIKRVTGSSLSSPLYTNIDPAQGVAGLKNQTIEQPADQEAQGIARIANANKIRGEMIDSMVKANGGNGGGILGDLGGGMTQTDLDNAEKTRRWRNDELLAKANRGNQGAIAALLNTEGGRDVAAMGNETSRQNAGLAARVANNRDQVTMRGQDLNAQNEAARIAGNPLDNQTKKLSLTQAQKIAQLQDNASAGDPKAIAELKMRGIIKSPDDKWELGYRKTKDINGIETQEPVVVTKDFGKQQQMTPQQEYQNAIASAKGDPAKIKLIQDRARQNGVIQ